MKYATLKNYNSKITIQNNYFSPMTQIFSFYADILVMHPVRTFYNKIISNEYKWILRSRR